MNLMGMRYQLSNRYSPSKEVSVVLVVDVSKREKEKSKGVIVAQSGLSICQEQNVMKKSNT